MFVVTRFSWFLEPAEAGYYKLLLRCRLARLELDVLAGVADPLAFVRFRLAERADFGRELADHLLVAALDGDVRLVRHRYGQPLGDRSLQLVRQSHAKLQHLPLESRQIADADDLQLLLVALLHADDHVVHDRTGQPVQSPGLPLVILAADDDLLVRLVHLHVYFLAVLPGELPLGPFHVHGLAADADLDAVQDGNRFIADA